MPETRVGTVSHYFPKVSVAIVKLDAAVKVGDTLRVKGAHDDFTFRLGSMQVDHRGVPEAKPGQEVGVQVPEKAHEGSEVFRVAPEGPPAAEPGGYKAAKPPAAKR